MRLIDIKVIYGKIRLETGLHIGSGGMDMQIGGTDSTVIKHPHTMEPYIPGSSIKGKVRSLLELRSGLKGENPLQGKNWDEENISAKKTEYGKILKIFGSSGADDEKIAEQLGPTRVSFADCPLLSPKSSGEKDQSASSVLTLTEIKAENNIKRTSGTAGAPRFIERVPAGLEFKFSAALKILDEREDPAFYEFLLQGLKLLEMDALGGNGSRGYGKIKFHFFRDAALQEIDQALQDKFDKMDPLSKLGG